MLHLFGSKFCSIWCADFSVIFQVELLEEKYQLRGWVIYYFEAIDMTFGLLLRMMRPKLLDTNADVIDSCFCVVKGIFKLVKKGI